MQTVKQILQGALQRCIDEHGVAVTSIEVKVNDCSTVGARNYLIDGLDINAKLVHAKDGE